MVTVATRVRTIADLEGFDLVVKEMGSGTEVPVKRNGVLGPYPYNRKLKSGKTIANWKRDRFESAYPGFTCDILNGDGDIAPPQTLLGTVRESYEEE